MATAELVDGSVPSTTFDACPNARPTDIMKWYRKAHPPKNQKPKKDRKPQQSPSVDKAYAAIVELAKGGQKLPTQTELAEAIGAKRLNVRMALQRWNAEQKLAANAKAGEDAALAKAEATFSDKSKLTLADAIRIHKARLDKTFEQRVSDEVKKRIAAANDAVRERLKKADQAILQFERERGKHGIYSEQEFKQMVMLCHPDDSLSDGAKANLLQILLKNKTKLVNPEKK